VASGSSAKKVARLAQKGKGKKVRFQDGTLFPTVMAVVVILGFGLISYARQAPSVTDAPPTVSDRWHIPIGFYHCDAFLQDLQGDKQGGDVADPNFTKYGVFSKDDGVIRWYPQIAAAGKKAKLGVYLETYGVTVDTKGITFPADQNKGVSYKVDTDKCKDENGKEVDATVQVIVWEKASDSTVSKRYITDFKNIRIDRDEMAITIAFVPTGADIPMPDSAEKLAEIVAAEYGAAPTTTVKGATTTSVAAPTTTGG
jgi:hypothetical protein